MRSRNNTTMSSAIVIARLSKRRWPSWSETLSNLRWSRNRFVSYSSYQLIAKYINLVVQLVDQNSTLKKEAGIAERKLLARNERIQNLEALLQDADRRLSVQNQKFEAQLQAVKERLDQARGKVISTVPEVPCPEHCDPFKQHKRPRPPRSILAVLLSPCEAAVAQHRVHQVPYPFQEVVHLQTLSLGFRTKMEGAC